MKVSSEILKVVNTANIVLWRVASCSLLAKHQRYKGTYCLQLTRKTQAADATKDIFACLHQLLLLFVSALSIRQVSNISNPHMNQFESGRLVVPRGYTI